MAPPWTIRRGREEFAAVLPETNGHDAYRLAERLRRAVAGLKIAPSGGSLRVTLSIGVGELHGRHGSTEELIAEADVALYDAKSGGRNRVGWCDLLGPPRTLQEIQTRPAAPPG